jgi:hypothetical protein
MTLERQGERRLARSPTDPASQPTARGAIEGLQRAGPFTPAEDPADRSAKRLALANLTTRRKRPALGDRPAFAPPRVLAAALPNAWNARQAGRSGRLTATVPAQSRSWRKSGKLPAGLRSRSRTWIARRSGPWTGVITQPSSSSWLVRMWRSQRHCWLWRCR